MRCRLCRLHSATPFERVSEHKNLAIGKHFHEPHGRSDLLNESHFKILRKCRGKFDCLVFEMLYIKKFKPNLNVQTDSIRAKLCLTCKYFFSTLIDRLKPRPNDRNMPTEHIATLLGATCCVRLATLLRHVATCWVLLAQI